MVNIEKQQFPDVLDAPKGCDSARLLRQKLLLGKGMRGSGSREG